MKNILLIILITFCCSTSYPYTIIKNDSLKINFDSIKADCSLYQIDINLIDSLNLCYGDSLILGRFLKSPYPFFEDWHFYLPYEDTLSVDLYNEEDTFIIDLLKKYISEGYYSFRISNKLPSGVYIISFKTSKHSIIRKCILIR